MNALTQGRLKEVLSYDPNTGIFIWVVSKNGRVKKGMCAGTKHCRGYRQICIDGKIYLSHRLAFLYETGEFPEEQCDHINGDRSDNRFINLRVVSQSENQHNIGGIPRNNKSGFLGVSWCNRTRKWVSKIMINKYAKCLGYFESKKEAHFAYMAAKDTLHPTHKRLRGESL